MLFSRIKQGLCYLVFYILFLLYSSVLGFGWWCLFFFFIEVYLIYTVVIVSSVQQSDSVLHTYISVSILCHYRLGYYKILNIVP